MRGFGDLEATIMERLWAAAEPLTVRQVHTELAEQRTLAYTTVMTVMDKLHRKGWLDREPLGRAYLYRPVLSREQYTADLMGEALSASSDRTATLLAFVDHLAPAEAAQLRLALEELPEPSPPRGRAKRTRRG